MANSNHIHILGIAGTFMANLAVLARQLGFKVTGADANVYPPMSDILENEQIEYVTSYDLDQNQKYLEQAECVVVGNVMSRGNPCVEYILDNKLFYTSGPAWLAEKLLHSKWVLAVSGTHGKTTTSSILAWILEYNNLNPGYLIGGKANNFSEATRNTDSKYFVIEADEYDTAFFDKRPKFLHYLPNTLIINNIEFDHADIYPDVTAIEQQFGYLLRTVPSNNGMVVAPDFLYDKLAGDSEITRKYGFANKRSNFKLPAKYFGIVESKAELNKPENKDRLLAVLSNPDGSVFDCYYNNKSLGTVTWNCLGDHNVYNALASITAAGSVGIKFEDAIAALASFKGVARRLDKKAELPNNVIVFDDFAHHPTAIKTTLSGLKKHYNNFNLSVVVDFNSYSMQKGVFNLNQIASALSIANNIYIYQGPYVKWECQDLLTSKELSANGTQTALYKNPEELITSLVDNISSNQVIVFMTKGDFNKNIDKFINQATAVVT